MATDLGPEFGRDQVWQIARAKGENARHALPSQLVGRDFGGNMGFEPLESLMKDGWRMRVTRLSDEFTFEDWKAKRPKARLLGRITESGDFQRLTRGDAELLFPKRAEAEIDALDEGRRATAREELLARRTEVREKAARARMASGVRLVALVAPEVETQEPSA